MEGLDNFTLEIIENLVRYVSTSPEPEPTSEYRLELAVIPKDGALAHDS